MSLQLIDTLEKHIVESGVKKPIKLVGTKSSGEAKFHIGSSSNSDEFDNFFNNFSELNLYKLKKENLKEFLQSTKFEYIYQIFQQYQEISLEYWESKYSDVMKLDDEEIFTLRRFTDSRYYIFSNEPIFKNLLRSITLPYLTKMIISKYLDDEADNYIYEFSFYLNENVKREEKSLLDNYDKEYLNRLNVGKNHIIYGAPGTGKSYKVDAIYPSLKRRVTFHPEYTYYDFVGSYRPVPVYKQNSSHVNLIESDGIPFNKGEPLVDYRFVPGPFTLSLVDALSDENQLYTLIIEELNRANTPAVFGDLFQLLDRNNDGTSTYSVTNIDIANYLRSTGLDIKNNEIEIPSNLNIVATMNSSDQGVFLMDSAFKRRWNFEYLPINIDDAEHKNEMIPYNNGFVKWGEFVTKINNLLSSEHLKINEDKHIGPYFIKPSDLKDKTNEEKKDIISSKLLIYLWDDVVRLKHTYFFVNPTTFSNLISRYNNGERIIQTDFEMIRDSEQKYKTEGIVDNNDE